MAHRAAGLPYLVHLRHPTTGGVYASWGSLGHLTVAEPGALIGFLGPKVYEALNGQPFPDGVQTAENLAAKGVIDAVVADEDLPELVDRALAVLVDPPAPPTLPRRTDRPTPRPVGLERPSARDPPRRPGRRARPAPLRLHGHHSGCTARDEGERDDSVVTALTRLDGQPCVLVGQDRSRQSPRTRWARRPCERPGEPCDWPRSCGCPWSPSSTHPAPSCHRQQRRARSPARSPAASPPSPP